MIISKNSSNINVYLRDMRYFLNKYKPIQALNYYRYCKHFYSFLLNTDIPDLVSFDEYCRVLYNIENMLTDFNKVRRVGRPNTPERWQVLGFTTKSSKVIASFYTTSLESFILRYGKNEGLKKYKLWINNFSKERMKNGWSGSKSYFSPQYWIEKGVTDNEAKKLSKEINTRNLDYFIKKYGVVEGEIRYNNMRITRSKSSSKEGYIKNHGIEKYIELGKKKSINLDHFILKYGDMKGRKEYTKFTRNRLRQTQKSKPAIKLENSLSQIYDIESEFLVAKSHFDYKIHENILIEVNGDWWHMNPLKYHDNFWNSVLAHYAKDIRLVDQKKIKKANQLGFCIVTIWERCINFDFDNLIVKLRHIIEKLDEKNEIVNFDINFDERLVIQEEIS
jgi:G:T-mismatch repair DNA endonuclease (very short patch repair protein)